MSNKPQSDAAAVYDSKTAGNYDTSRVAGSEIVNQVLDALGRDPKKVIDLGCGTGSFGVALKNLGYEVIGIDNSPEMVKQAQAKGIEAHVADMRNVPYDNESFDGAYIIQALHHVAGSHDIPKEKRDSERKKAVKETYRILKPNSSIAVVQCSHKQNKARWWWNYFPEGLTKKLEIQPTTEEIMTWMSAAGFTDIGTVTYADVINTERDIPGNYLDRGWREATYSEFKYLTEAEKEAGEKMLREAVDDGTVWDVIKEFNKKVDDLGGNQTLVKGTK